MSGPDWSKAPEGAQFWMPKERRLWGVEWYKNIGVYWYYHDEIMGWMRDYTVTYDAIILLVKRS